MSEEIELTQENVNAAVMNAFDQGYKQGWIHSQQALSEWVGEIGKIDQENANFYNELSQVIAKLQIVEEENAATTDMSEVSEDKGSNNDSAGV